MAEDEISRRQHHHKDSGNAVEIRRKSTRKRASHKSAASPAGHVLEADKPTTLDELRKRRLDYLSKPPEEKKASKATMKYVYEPRENQRPAQYVRKVSDSRRPKKAASTVDRDRHRKKSRKPKTEDDNSNRVYDQPPRNSAQIDESEEELYEDEIQDDSTKVPTNISGNNSAHKSRDSIHRSRTSRTKSRTTEATRGTRPSVRRHVEPSIEEDEFEDVEPVKVSRAKSSRAAPSTSRPTLRRSATTVPKPAATAVKKQQPVRSNTDPTPKDERKPSGILATLFGGASTANLPEKKVTCLTCMEDDVPISKAAKLSCTHYMCHACLRRIFKLSLTDPQHMPPKCCTSEHIPLKHVDKLFDMKFKVKWNRKYQEYMTRNRIYCPSRGCGEWIKPSHITMEHGRKVGVCKRCHTRVCCLCNNKMHKSRECPNDEATKQFIETAKNEGWQRCFNCSAMVELKEGCNHMTCRCTAEFCMICGAKWKTCDCPWFNYSAVEADRLLNMNVPEARRQFANGQGRAPVRYQEELERRRDQERRDEAMARRLQAWGLNEARNNDPAEGDVVGIGNAGAHFMNENFVQAARQVLAGDFRRAQQEADILLNGAISGRENPLPPPFDFLLPSPNVRRHHSTASRAYNTSRNTRPSERVVPARRTNDYQAEAAIHQPRPSEPEGDVEVGQPPAPNPRAAGLGRRNTTRAATGNTVSNLIGRPDPSGRETGRRIENWRNAILPGSEI